MRQIYNSLPITGFAGAVAQSMGIAAPVGAEAAAPGVAQLLRASCGTRKADRVLLYHPDAISMWLFQKYTTEFAPVVSHAPLALPVISSSPAVTPVCFASMYSGTKPNVHGIVKYQKKQLQASTLFDMAIADGKKAAVVSVQNSFMSLMFTGRDMEYFNTANDTEALLVALTLIEEDRHDLIAVYNQGYDDIMHTAGPESPAAQNALRGHVSAFAALCDAVDANWKGHDTLVCWATDHGVHINSNGSGAHGGDSADDMNIMHFYGVKPRQDTSDK